MNGVIQVIQVVGEDEFSERKVILVNDSIECQLQIGMYDNDTFIDLDKIEAKKLGKELIKWANQ